MPAPVQPAQVSAHDTAATARVMREWSNRYCRGRVEAFISDLVFPVSTLPRIEVKIGRNTAFFRPLPFAHDQVILVGGQPCNGSLPVLFYDAANGMFLPAMVVLPYAERLHFIGRSRRQFVARLVAAARLQHARTIA